MDTDRFFKALPPRYYAWATVFAYPRTAEPYCRILDSVQGMTTPSVMQLLSTAVECLEPGECYLEVGTWRGATFLGALVDNPGVHGYAIDDDTMNDHDKDERPSADVWRENIETFGIADRAHYITGSTPSVWGRSNLTDGRPVGVYLFDGDKSTPEAALDGLMGVAPFLADTALIVIDDANTRQIRIAAMNFIRRHLRHSLILMDLPTPGNCWSGFWNGLLVLGWSRGG
jgi:hypothetical protein